MAPGKFLYNLKLQNVITLKPTDIGRKAFTFITYSPDSVGLKMFCNPR
jgi:hypothetical protein